MIPFDLYSISKILDAKLVTEKNFKIFSLSTDSRKIKNKKNCLFIALKGNRFDAHSFVEDAIKNGAIALLINYQVKLDIAQIIVKDTYLSFCKIATWIRKKICIQMIAITGSSGKTSVKEITSSILSSFGKVLSTYKNENNEIGVPLTLIRLTPKYDFAVIEVGSNNFGEISWSSQLIKPNIVLINNILPSHLKNFKSIYGIAKAKEEIFSGLSTGGRVILNDDSNYWKKWKESLHDKLIWKFSIYNKNVDFFASKITCNSKGLNFLLHSPEGIFSIRNIPLFGIHNVSNILASIAISFSSGISLKKIISSLSNIQPIPGRLFPIYLSKGKILLDDSYNANVGSVITSAQVLTIMPGYRIIVIGNMEELGEQSIIYHKKIGIFLRKIKIDKILCIGKLSYFIYQMNSCSEYFYDQYSLITYLTKLFSYHNKITVLIKGSRKSRMEKIVHSLLEKFLC